MDYLFWIDRKEARVGLEKVGDGCLRVSVNDQTYDVSAEFIGREEILLNVDGRVFNVVIHSNSLSHSVFVNGRLFRVEKRSALKTLPEERARQRKKDVKITMPGRVIQVFGTAGEEVKEGQPVLVLEAMKMQNEIKAPHSGRLSRVNYGVGDYVEAGSVLFSIE
jgi:biotin carboxyl carrier protein